MKIMTFNIQHCYNFLLKEIDYEILSSEIKSLDLDVVGINEIYGSNESIYGNQVEKLAKMSGYNYYYFAKAFDHKDGPYGNAIFSRIPFESAETIIITSPLVKKNPYGYYEDRCLLVANLANGIKIIVTHFGLNEDEIEKEVSVLLEHLDDKKCIFMGDLNVSYENKLIAPLTEILNDASENFCQNVMTWPSDNPQVKIDYIFVSKDLVVKDAFILKKIISDHLAHVAVIKD